MELAAFLALLGGFDHAVGFIMISAVGVSTVARFIIITIRSDAREIKKELHKKSLHEPKPKSKSAAA